MNSSLQSGASTTFQYIMLQACLLNIAKIFSLNNHSNNVSNNCFLFATVLLAFHRGPKADPTTKYDNGDECCGFMLLVVVHYFTEGISYIFWQTHRRRAGRNAGRLGSFAAPPKWVMCAIHKITHNYRFSLWLNERFKEG